MKEKEKIEKFIKDNGLSFVEGCRNTDSVVLSGYCLYLGITDITVILNIINNICKTITHFEDEFERVFKYAENHNYGNWWKTKEAKKAYKF